MLPPSAPPAKTPPNGSPPLWRFVLVAAVIVLVVGAIVVGRKGQIADFTITATPQPSQTPTRVRPALGGAPHPAQTFSASASWVMSALPGCFIERQRISGPLADLRTKLPPAGARLASGTHLTIGTCTIDVQPDAVVIERADDRMQAPNAALYRTPTHLILVTIHASARTARGATADIRTYDTASTGN